jgi:DNA repair photolyase
LFPVCSQPWNVARILSFTVAGRSRIRSLHASGWRSARPTATGATTIETLDGPPVKLRTTVTEEHPKTILTFNQSPDVGFDRSINAYRGASTAASTASPGRRTLSTTSRPARLRDQAVRQAERRELLRETLARPKYRPRQIAMGTNTDPYQPIEGRYRITRSCSSVPRDAPSGDDHHQVRPGAARPRPARRAGQARLVAVAVSVTTLDARLSGLLEPRASAPAKRLARSAAGRGRRAAHCSVAPVIPAITDEFIEAILARAGALGVRSAGWIRCACLRGRAAVPRVARGALSRTRRQGHGIVRSIRGGRDNDPQFFSRMKPSGVWAELLRSRFRIARKRAGIDNPRFELDCSQFRRPTANGQAVAFSARLALARILRSAKTSTCSASATAVVRRRARGQEKVESSGLYDLGIVPLWQQCLTNLVCVATRNA